MSFRELRNLTEYLKELSYPRVVSMENFRSANFELTADILFWLVQRLAPRANAPSSIETEDERVHFLGECCAIVQREAGVEMKAHRLYAGDGTAVKELLKLVIVLRDARRSRGRADAGKGGPEDGPRDDAGAKSLDRDIQRARELGAETTRHGATLHDLMQVEQEASRDRAAALAFLEGVGSPQGPEQSLVQQRVRELLEGVEAQTKEASASVTDLEHEEANLSKRLHRKEDELKRLNKRMRALDDVRPAFMDEYERLEVSLREEYASYVNKVRNLSFLEESLAEMEALEKRREARWGRGVAGVGKSIREDEFKTIRQANEIVILDDHVDDGADNIHNDTAVVPSRKQRRGRDAQEGAWDPAGDAAGSDGLSDSLGASDTMGEGSSEDDSATESTLSSPRRGGRARGRDDFAYGDPDDDDSLSDDSEDSDGDVSSEGSNADF